MGSRQTSESSSKSPYSRPLQVALRSLHIAAMGVVLGGVAFGATTEQLRLPLLLTVGSGLCLAVAAVWWRCLALSEGAGWALFLKFGLLGLASAVPGAKLELFLAATVVTSIGSHMPASWRHRALPGRERRVE